ncbi:MAG: DUF4437 domain-containing protein [Deltaproteobacteria bacterium]|nr:DUF4437 domain-containing protein [Deltaproteobacteria bacterium]
MFAVSALAADKAAPAAPAPAAAAAAAPKMAVTPAAELKWAPLDPKSPMGLQVSMVEGDMAKGPVTFFLKLPAGSKSGLHAHTNDYFSVVISGAPAHGVSDKDPGKPLAVGSMWFQPAKDMHHDSCTGDKECVLLLHYPKGGFDFIPGPAAAVPAKK